MEFDVQCRDFSQKLEKLLNESGMPLTVMGFVLNKYLMIVQNQLDEVLKKADKEKKEKEQQKKEEKNEEGQS